MRSSWKLKRGFSLLEIILGTLLFTTMILFVVTIWAQHARIIGKSRNRMTASFICEFKTEQFISYGYQQALSQASLPQSPVEVSTVMRGQEITTPFNYTVVVKDPADPVLKDLVGILLVTVYFPDEQADSTYKEIHYETYLAKPQN